LKLLPSIVTFFSPINGGKLSIIKEKEQKYEKEKPVIKII
jgi:hypothetical protein